jgi:hypothetical protein
MANIRAGVNKGALARTLKSKKFMKGLKPNFKKIFISHANKVIKEMLREFNSHPVTLEIESGPLSSNKSGTLSGKGNLFSFIGFSHGSDPIKPLRQLLSSTRVEFLNVSQGTIDFKIYFPEDEEIYALTPMPWAKGRSWVRGIERGMSGLGQYLYTNKNLEASRSSTAIQIESKIRGGRFKNVSYISEIRRNFYKKIKQLSKTSSLI